MFIMRKVRPVPVFPISLRALSACRHAVTTMSANPSEPTPSAFKTGCAWSVPAVSRLSTDAQTHRRQLLLGYCESRCPITFSVAIFCNRTASNHAESRHASLLTFSGGWSIHRRGMFRARPGASIAVKPEDAYETTVIPRGHCEPRVAPRK